MFASDTPVVVRYKLSVTCCHLGLKILLTFHKINPNSLGDACVAQSTQPGICMDIRRCISVRNDMLNGKQNHFTCSTRGMTEIVCCPIRQRTTTPTYTTAFPTTKRTKTTRTPRITTPQSVRISVESNHSTFLKKITEVRWFF